MALNMNDAAALTITEGDVRTIHDNNGQLLWGKLYYDTKYKGDTTQQTYTGKNLFNKNNYNLFEGYLSGSPTGTIAANANNDIFYIPCQPNTTYSISKTTSLNFAVACSTVIPSNGSAFTGRVSGNSAPNLTITTDATASYLIVWARNGNIGGEISRTEVLNTLQIEIGSPTAYEPYVGGIPAPNPDYPQAVNVVTGTQTITLSDGNNSENYTVNLGTTELCKISTYQDYIYKSGDDWYVHKEVGVISDMSSLSWSQSTVSGVFSTLGNNMPSGVPLLGGNIMCCAFTWQSGNIPPASMNEGSIAVVNSQEVPIMRVKYSTLTPSNISSVLSGVRCYYALATPTDTEITDADLVSDLNAIHQFLTRYGYNASVSGNLPLIIDKTALS